MKAALIIVLLALGVLLLARVPPGGGIRGGETIRPCVNTGGF
jgi:hypothetical protein